MDPHPGGPPHRTRLACAHPRPTPGNPAPGLLLRAPAGTQALDSRTTEHQPEAEDADSRTTEQQSTRSSHLPPPATSRRPRRPQPPPTPPPGPAQPPTPRRSRSASAPPAISAGAARAAIRQPTLLAHRQADIYGPPQPYPPGPQPAAASRAAISSVGSRGSGRLSSRRPRVGSSPRHRPVPAEPPAVRPARPAACAVRGAYQPQYGAPGQPPAQYGATAAVRAIRPAASSVPSGAVSDAAASVSRRRGAPAVRRRMAARVWVPFAMREPRIVAAPPGTPFHRLARTAKHAWWRPIVGTAVPRRRRLLPHRGRRWSPGRSSTPDHRRLRPSRRATTSSRATPRTSPSRWSCSAS